MIAGRQLHTCRTLLLLLLLLAITGCRSSQQPVIAVIPRTTGTLLWDPMQSGAQLAAQRNGYRIYWNAPVREDDVEAQIALMQQAEARSVAGLIIAPTQGLALITPLRRAVEHGIPTVVVSSGLPIPIAGPLSYVLNDEDFGAELAADRISLLPKPPAILILGLNPDISGIMERARSLEALLRARYPGARIIKRRGNFDAVHEQQVAEELLRSDPSITVVVGLMWSSTRGALDAIHDLNRCKTKVIGFDPDGALPFRFDALDSVIVQDTRTMGEDAVDLIALSREGLAKPDKKTVRPVLITRDNQNAPALHEFTSATSESSSWQDGTRQ